MTLRDPKLRIRLLAVACALVAGVSGCSVSAPGFDYSFQVNYDTPALRALKAEAHMQACPTLTTPPTGQLPNVSLPCLGGGPSINLASLRGPMLINMWEDTCAPCRAEMPYLQAFAREHRSQVTVLGIDLVDTQPDQALAFAKSAGVTFPMIADLDPVIRTPGVPTTILINAHGTIVFQRPIPFSSQAQIAQIVQHYLGLTLAPHA